MSQPPPTADATATSPEPTGAKRTAHVRAGRAHGIVVFLAVLVGMGLAFGAGAAAAAPVAAAAPETIAEEAVADEIIPSRRVREAKQRRPRTGCHRRERLTWRWARRALPALRELAAAVRCTPRRGPPLLTD